MKRKILISLFIIFFIVLSSGVTYSAFNSQNNINVNQKLAKFIFETNVLDNMEIQIDDLVPGDTKEYSFSVTNTDKVSSDVSLNYQLSIKTFHFIPLKIELYKLNGSDENLILDCNESFSRNANNELVCNTDVLLMENSNSVNDNYILKLVFPSEYNGLEYMNLSDFINVEINSWQSVEGV